MVHKDVRTELDQIAVRLQEDGLAPGASAEEQQRHLWRQLLCTEAKLHSATQGLQTLSTQHANEMKEVESYVEQIRGLQEKQECLTAEYERYNEQLRLELQHIRLQQENQLAQKDRGEMGLSSSSEQVAYLLVERATLLERLECTERRLETQNCMNEELEALLGEAQNASEEERQRHEGELEGMHRRIKSLESELLKNGEDGKETESYLQQLRDRSHERVALIQARLTEEKDWRKQLEVDLCTAQAALKNYKEALQIGERELKKLRMEVNSLETECQQGKTLIKSLTQVKGEKAVLEEKVAQLEHAQTLLQSELDCHKDSSWSLEDLKESSLQVDQLRQQTDPLTTELTSLKTAHNTLKDKMVTARLQKDELQAQLTSSIQEKLAAEGERERLGLEAQRLMKQLQWHQEQLSSRQEASSSSQEPEPHTTFLFSH